MSDYHIPVLLQPALELLNIKPGNWYIDCNLGGGGHTSAILKHGGKVLGIDLDEESIKEVAGRYNLSIRDYQTGIFAISDELIIAQDNFANLENIIERFGLKKIAGVLFDLGVSTHQLESETRGFSFNQDSELDMRMDQRLGVSALDLVNGLHEKELANLFWKLGEEHFSRQIAKKIVEVRKHKPIRTTNELASIVLSVRHRSLSDRTHPATRVFQALRIAVNDELHSLQDTLPQAFSTLDENGRLVVISFHSLEDRIVKNYFNDLEKSRQAILLTDKPIDPTEEEVSLNPRSRSGKLRAIEKI